MIIKYIKKITLIFIGIVLSLIILELSMRFAGSAISVYQNYKNNKALKNKTKYTVMCLGESTTFEQYPKQLQTILERKYPNKFSVVDCGVPGISIQKILAKLDGNIKKYKPDFAICMMGINNGLVFHDSEKNITVIKNIYLKFLNYMVF